MESKSMEKTIIEGEHLEELDHRIIVGNDEICQMLGFETNKVYCYKVPNTFPFEKECNTGWTEFYVQAMGFHTDWNMLIGAYNRALSLLEALPAVQKKLLKEDKNIIVQFGTKNFFGLFENQLHIMSSWIKLVDIAKWYNSIKLMSAGIHHKGSNPQ